MDLTELKSVIECIVCFDVRREGYIYHCENGHNICSECKTKVHRCPSGNCSYLGNARNLTAEKLRSNSSLQFPCKYANNGCVVVQKAAQLDVHEPGCTYRKIQCPHGCGKTLTAQEFETHEGEYHNPCQNEEKGCRFNGTHEEIKYHENECIFRLVQCPCGICKQLVSENDMLQHLTTSHRVPKRDIDSTNSFCNGFLLRRDMSGKTWKVCYYIFDHQCFLLRFRVSDNGLYHAWLQIIGSDSKAKGYEAKITVEGNGCKIEMKNRKVYPIDIKAENIMMDDDCFSLSIKQVKQLRSNDVSFQQDLEGKSHKINVHYQVHKVV